MRPDPEAFKAVLEDASSLGISMTRTRLAKVLYLADLHAVANGFAPFTGARWRWEQYGPFDSALLAAEDDLLIAGVITRSKIAFSGGKEVRLAIVAGYSAELPSVNRAAISEVIAKYGSLSLNALKAVAYDTAPMRAARSMNAEGERLDLTLALRTSPLGDKAEHYREILKSLPERRSDPKVHGEIADEIEFFAPLRSEALRHHLD